MNQDIIKIQLQNAENELKIMKEQKEKLNGLLDKIKKSREEFVDSNLSGKTYESSIRNNDLFIKNIENRINEFTTLINKLEETCNIYNNYVLSTHQSVAGER